MSSDKNPIIDTVIVPNTNTGENQNSEFKSNYHGYIVHEGYPKDSVVQKIVNYAYKLGGYNFVAVLECENGSYDLKAVGDGGHAYSLCQVNDRFHKDIPSEFTTNWVVAVEYCFQKWKQGVAFYGPSRIIKGQKCYEYIKPRFTFIE